MVSFFKHTIRALAVPAAVLGAVCFFAGSPKQVLAADSTAKIHVLTLDSGSDAVILESVDSNGQKIFGMVDSGEDWDYPDGSDPRYPLRSGITTSVGYDEEVLSYLDSLGVNSGNLEFYVATHPHSDHIGTGDTIVRQYSPDRVYLLPYEDRYISNAARLWDNLYVYDELLAAVEETSGVTLIQHLNPGAASAEDGSPNFSFGNFQIQIVNYDEDYLTSPKNDANQFCLGVIASANGHRAFLTSDIDDSEGDASRIVANYGLYSIDFMTSNHHGYPDTVSADYLAAVNPDYFVQTGNFHIMSNDTVATLSSLGIRVFSTAEYASDTAAIVTDFSGSTVTSNVDDTYEFYQDRSSRLVVYHDGIPYSGFFTRGSQKYYADTDHLLVRNTSWRDSATGMEYTADENGVITSEHQTVGWVKRDGKWYYYQDSDTPYTGWLTLNHTTYYLGSDGVMKTGWLLLDGNYYWFSNSGAMQTGWQFISNNWYYLAKDTGIMYADGWHADPDSKTMYYFYKWGGAARNTTLTLNGYRVKFLSWGGISGSTWIYRDGNWYYVQKYSCIGGGWHQIDKAWYFMNDDGSMKRNESFIYQNNLYFVNQSGKMYQNQWLNWNGNYYYLRSWGGAAHEGWLHLGAKWYFINEDGTRKTNEAFAYQDNLYFVDQNGEMLSNQWVSRDGIWYFTYSWGGARKSQWFHHKNNWYYFNDDASMQTGWAEINGKTYYFLSWGGRVTGTKKIDGKTYSFDQNGVLLSKNAR
ncbi:hypothetical protein [Fusicatenibacter sp.]